MATIKVSERQCPDFRGDHLYWERSLDPFHIKALPKGASKVGYNKGKRLSGWMAIDANENAIGFVVDGTEVESEDVAWMYYPGPYDRIVAMPMSSDTLPAIKRHLDMRKERQRKNLTLVERTVGLVNQARSILQKICKKHI